MYPTEQRIFLDESVDVEGKPSRQSSTNKEQLSNGAIDSLQSNVNSLTFLWRFITVANIQQHSRRYNERVITNSACVDF